TSQATSERLPIGVGQRILVIERVCVFGRSTTEKLVEIAAQIFELGVDGPAAGKDKTARVATDKVVAGEIGRLLAAKQDQPVIPADQRCPLTVADRTSFTRNHKSAVAQS